MGNEKQTNAAQPQKPQPMAQPLGTPAPSAPSVLMTPEQFAALQRTIITAAAVFGMVASGKQPTMSIGNLKQLTAYVDGVLELVNR